MFVMMELFDMTWKLFSVGLTTEERDIVEAGFRTGAIRVLVATSTLSSGTPLNSEVISVIYIFQVMDWFSRLRWKPSWVCFRYFKICQAANLFAAG